MKWLKRNIASILIVFGMAGLTLAFCIRLVRHEINAETAVPLPGKMSPVADRHVPVFLLEYDGKKYLVNWRGGIVEHNGTL